VLDQQLLGEAGGGPVVVAAGEDRHDGVERRQDEHPLLSVAERGP